MSFIEMLGRAKALLREHGRLSFRALEREFDLDAEGVDVLVEELVDVQQVAAREGKVLSWVGPASTRAASGPVVQVPPPAVTAPLAEAERRQLTVMFCDLVGSTDIAQRLDAEEWRNLLHAYHEIAGGPIARHEGRVAQVLGDGLLVYFGHPLAHEDDAERGVHAGIEFLSALRTANDALEDQYGVRLQARVGIHTGPVVIGEMGEGASRETLALGDTTNIAARLERLAEPGQVVVSEATLRLAPGLFVTRDLGTPPLKGVKEPIHAYQVLQATGVRSRLDRDPSMLTPLVGRDQELAFLIDRWEHAQEGQGEGVLIAGEPGLGKSRLIEAFRGKLTGTAHTWLECRCTPYTQGSALQPSIDLLEQGLGLKPGDDPEAKLVRIERGIARAGLDVPEVVPLIAALLSVPTGDRYPPIKMSPELQRQKTMEALVNWPIGLAESQPLVILYEDLHWSDPSTLEMLGLALEQGVHSSALMLLTFRPEFSPPWPRRSHVNDIGLHRLTVRQARTMIGSLTPDLPLPEAAVEQIVERADGIPLFVEEITKMVIESDLVEEREGRYALATSPTELAVPATLQDSLMARLDRLELGKPVAQVGAVLGREFPYDLLRSVSPLDEAGLLDGLQQLVGAELLYQRGTVPDANFTFKHALVQEAAYQSVLRSSRRGLHERVASVLEAQFPERVEAEPGFIAHHLDAAGLGARAREQYQRAGERGIAQSANEEAIVHLQRALELVAQEDDTSKRNEDELELLIMLAAPLGASRGWSDPECEGAFTRARELVGEIGDVPELARVLTGLATSFASKGDLATSAELAQQGLEVAQRTGDALHLPAAHYTTGNPLYWQGDVAGSLVHFEAAMEAYDPEMHGSLVQVQGLDWDVMARCFAAWCHWMLGAPDRAIETVEEATRVAMRVEHPIAMAQCLSNHLALHVLRGEPDRAAERADLAIDHAERHGFPLFEGIARVCRGWAHVEQGGDGIEEMQQGMAGLAQIGAGVGAPALLTMMATGLWRKGRIVEAFAAIDLAVANAEGTGQHLYDAELLRLRAEVLLAGEADRREEALVLLEEALDVARRQGIVAWELRVANSVARLWNQTGREREARALLEPLIARFEEGLELRDLQEARAQLP